MYFVQALWYSLVFLISPVHKQTGDERRGAIGGHWSVKILGLSFVCGHTHWGNLKSFSPKRWLFICKLWHCNFFKFLVWMSWSTSRLTWLYLCVVVEVAKHSLSSAPIKKPNPQTKTKPEQKRCVKQVSRVSLSIFQGLPVPFGTMEKKNSLTDGKGFYRDSYCDASQYIQLLSPHGWLLSRFKMWELLVCCLRILLSFQNLLSVYSFIWWSRQVRLPTSIAKLKMNH